MITGRKLRIYLDKGMRAAAEEGRNNFLNRLKNAVESRDVKVEYCLNSDANILKSRDRHGFTLFHMDDPYHEKSLTMRRVYYYPFWQIETSAKRWEWAVSHANFDPSEIDAHTAKSFAIQWRKRLFEGWKAIKNQGYVYMPLQGRLLEQRSFQSCSPVDMIRETIKHGPRKPIVATLHPGEKYNAYEYEALAELMEEYPEFTVQSDGNPESYLAECDCVVTQNSSVAFSGYFWHKPAVLFGKIDFHHIALNVGDLGAKDAFARLPNHVPDYDKYLYWFLQLQSINAGRPETEEKIIETLRTRGWDL
ncbi:hypothetical protein [Halocynthiibacter namhaensis]|uniref:hypothetical protein n=1 Tax=Halocynthiibacter namhaensis TaxID=1290553 RepID=UPI0005790DFB|nr:hypothetical protein [Halocynthiibacter namhaensis]